MNHGHLASSVSQVASWIELVFCSTFCKINSYAFELPKDLV